jgi:peptide methionine sulfoxide reductase MsrB
MTGYYRCTSDLYSIVIENLLKFSKDGVYECVGNNLFINNQRKKDFIAVEGWQKFFVPIDLEDVNIDELKEVLELQL